MNKISKGIIFLSAVLVALCSCKGGDKGAGSQERTEDRQAKQLLQGVWIDSDEENVVFKVKGDSVFYPDSLSQPVSFAVYADTLEMRGGHVYKYAIVRQSANIFEFKNQNGDIVKLVKSDDPYFDMQFRRGTAVTLHQRETVKKDTVMFSGEKRYHLYTQVNPTTYKVYKSAYNNEGLETESVFYDNTVHVSVYDGGAKVYSKDFSKADFSSVVPESFLKQSVLSDIIMNGADARGFHFTAQIAIPDTDTSYQADILITTAGRMTISAQK